jgi:hypothetical protein
LLHRHQLARDGSRVVQNVTCADCNVETLPDEFDPPTLGMKFNGQLRIAIKEPRDCGRQLEPRWRKAGASHSGPLSLRNHHRGKADGQIGRPSFRQQSLTAER